MNKKLIIGGVAALTLGLGLAACGPANQGGTTKDQPIQPSKPPAAAPAAPAPKPDTIDGSGTFAVPDQVKPGTYKTVVPDDSYGCYWARLKDSLNTLDSIITNQIGNPGTQQVVTITATDGYFETDSCGTWTLVG